AYNKENKSIDECCSYILGEAKKRGNAVAISDAEYSAWRFSYYDEDKPRRTNSLPRLITKKTRVLMNAAAISWEKRKRGATRLPSLMR
ncbi:hypothetical protein E7X19_26605, partial [Bacteroides fragilis]